MDDFIEREGPRVPRAARKRVQAVASTVSAEEMTDFESIFGAFATSMLASQQEMDEPDPELAVQVLSEVYGDELFEETVPGDGAPDAAQSKQLSKLMAAAFEPDEVGRLFVSDVDRAMREADIPERLFSLRGSRAQLLGEEGEAALAADTALAMQESAWIATRLLVELHESGYDVSRDSVCGNQYFASYAADPRYGEPVVGPDGGPTTSDPAVLAALTDGVSAILSLVLSANLEVCTVWAHRRESFPPVLRLHHLWRVLDLDEEWVRHYSQANAAAATLSATVQALQADGANSEAYHAEAAAQAAAPASFGAAGAALEAHRARRLAALQAAVEAVSPEAQAEVLGCISEPDKLAAPALADAALAAKALHTKATALLLVSKAAKAEELAAVKGSSGELALYAAAQGGGGSLLAATFTLPPSVLQRCVQEPGRQEAPPHVTESAFQSSIEACICAAFESEEDVLKSARFAAGLELAVHPGLRALARQVFRHHAHVSTLATSKGCDELEIGHAMYGLQALRNKPVAAFSQVQHIVKPSEARQALEAWASARAAEQPLDKAARRLVDAAQVHRHDVHDSTLADVTYPHPSTTLVQRRPDFSCEAGFGHAAGWDRTRVFLGHEVGQAPSRPSPGGFPVAQADHLHVEHWAARVGGPAQWLLLAQGAKRGLFKLEVHMGQRCPHLEKLHLPPGAHLPCALSTEHPVKLTPEEEADAASLDGEAWFLAWLAPLYLSAQGMEQWLDVAAQARAEGSLPAVYSLQADAAVYLGRGDLTPGACVPSLRARLQLPRLDQERLGILLTAINRFWLPSFDKELRAELATKAQERVAWEAASALRARAMTAPFRRPPMAPRETLADVPGGSLDTARALEAEAAAMASEGAARWDPRCRVLVLAPATRGSGDADAGVVLGRDGRVLELVALPRKQDEAQAAIVRLMLAHAPDVAVVCPSGAGASRRLLKDGVAKASNTAHEHIARARRAARRALRAYMDKGISLAAVLSGAAMDSSAMEFEGDSIRAIKQGSRAPRRSQTQGSVALLQEGAFGPGGALRDLAPVLAKWVEGGAWSKRRLRTVPLPEVAPRRGFDALPPPEPVAPALPHTLPVVLADADAPLALAESPAYAKEFPDTRRTMRLAVASGRYLQHPLRALAALWPLEGAAVVGTSSAGPTLAPGMASSSKQPLGLPLHPQQGGVPQGILLRALERVMVECAANCGVDINSLVRTPHAEPLLQFVPGLGPRKAKALLETLQAQLRAQPDAAAVDAAQRAAPAPLRGVATLWPTPLVSRSALLAKRLMEQTVFNNAAPFLTIPDPALAGAPLALKYDFSADGDMREDEGPAEAPALQRNPLDATLVHPAMYHIAVHVAGELDKQLSPEQQLEAQVGAQSAPPHPDEPRTYRALIRNVVRHTRLGFLKQLFEATQGKLPRDGALSTSRQGQFLPGPAGSWPPEEAFPGLLSSPGFLSEEEISQLGGRDRVTHNDDALAQIDIVAFAAALEDAGNERALYKLQGMKHQLRVPGLGITLPWAPPSPAAAFTMLTGETPHTLYPGLVTQARITRVMDFRLVVRLECGVSGILNRDVLLTPEQQQHLEQQGLTTQPGMHDAAPYGAQVDLTRLFKEDSLIRVRVQKVDYAYHSVTLTALQDMTRAPPPLPAMDPHVDIVALRLLEDAIAQELGEMQMDEADGIGGARLRGAHGTSLILRPIGHSTFKNLTSAAAVRYLEDKPLYTYVIRPSSKGPDHLTVSWKFAPSVVVHLSIKELDKPAGDAHGKRALGKRLLMGSKYNATTKRMEPYEYADLDELTARHMERLCDLIREARQDSNFRDLLQDHVDAELRDRRSADPDRIPYLVHPYAGHDETLLGTLILSWIPPSKRKQSIVKEKVNITPDGFFWARRIFPTIPQLIMGFKKHALSELKRRIRRKQQGGSSTPGSGAPRRSRFGAPASQMQAQPPMPQYAAGMPPGPPAQHAYGGDAYGSQGLPGSQGMPHHGAGYGSQYEQPHSYQGHADPSQGYGQEYATSQSSQLHHGYDYGSHPGPGGDI